MLFINLLQELFIPFDDQTKVEDKYSDFLVEYKCIKTKNLAVQNIQALIENITHYHSWALRVIIGNDDPITLTSSQGVETFIHKIQDSISLIDEEDIIVSFRIIKNTIDGIISIYDTASFLHFIHNMEVIKFLLLINNDLKKNKFLFFDVKDNTFCGFSTNHIGFGVDPRQFHNEIDASISKIREHCHFSSQDLFPYSPKYFNLISKTTSENSITLKLEQMTTIFLIISIYDITSIDVNQSNLYYKINGYKSIEGYLDIKTTKIESKATYLKIFNWIYSEHGNTTDKIGLARNILSIYLQDNSVEIPERAYSSIQSGFKVYLQQNLNRYIEIRNKITDQLLALSQKASQIIDSYLANYQKSNSIFTTFFISVFLVRVLQTGQFQDVFTENATVIALVLLFISILYLIFSLRVLNKEIERLKKKYNALKVRFEDLLDKEDINQILGNDTEFNEEISFVEMRRNEYTYLWILTLLIFLGLIFSLSSYINWSILLEMVRLIF